MLFLSQFNDYKTLQQNLFIKNIFLIIQSDIFLDHLLMKKELQDLLKNPNDIVHHQATLKTKPTTPQQKFYHTIGHLTLLKQKIVVAEFQELLRKYKGALSSKILSYKYMSYCMENKLVDKYYHFKILSALSSWIDRLQKLKKQQNLRLLNTVGFDLANRGMEGIEDTIVYLNYIGIDIISILQKQKTQEMIKEDTQTEIKQKKQQQFIWSRHLDVTDILKFTSGILPKILHNIILTNDFFPQGFLPSEAPTLDLLYCNENVEMIAKSRTQYQRLIRVLLKLLLASQTDQNQTKQLVLLTFRYYYIFHFDKTLGANQLIMQGFRKMPPIVRYALYDQILLFLTIIRKLGKDLFINYLANKFDWMPALIKKIDDNPMVGITKDLVKPFPCSQLNLFSKFIIARGENQTRYFQVNHKFSLFFYRVKALSDDITIKMFYLGPFDSPTQKKQILLSKYKHSQEFKGCIEVIEPGIYCFEFDNTYSWIKSKNVTLEWSILVPLQIIQQKRRPFLQVLFGNIEQNSVPQNKILKVIDQSAASEHQFWRHHSNFVRVTWNKTEKLFNITMILPNYTYQFQSESKRVLKRKFQKLGKMNENNQYLQWWIDRKKFKTWNEALNEIQLVQIQMTTHQLDEQQQFYQHSSEKNQQNYSERSDSQEQKQQNYSQLAKYHQLNEQPEENKQEDNNKQNAIAKDSQNPNNQIQKQQETKKQDDHPIQEHEKKVKVQKQIDQVNQQQKRQQKSKEVQEDKPSQQNQQIKQQNPVKSQQNQQPKQ